MNEIENYISGFPAEIQHIMHAVRQIIKEAAPGASELFAYGMPAYKTYGKPLVYFAGFKNHIGLYATPSGHEQFKAELSKYKQGKGSVQFPYTEPIPYDLIRQIVEFRVHENEMKSRK
jgi:uncharacterized protein YdhG (YjbR/CyaY superfamily)